MEHQRLAWTRFEAELERRGKSLRWLAEQMHCTPERFHNWRERGVPLSAMPELAEAFDESLEWVAGHSPPRAGGQVSAEAMQVARLFDRMDRQRQTRVLLFMLDDAAPSRTANDSDFGGLAEPPAPPAKGRRR
jgi:hypothetical protein